MYSIVKDQISEMLGNLNIYYSGVI